MSTCCSHAFERLALLDLLQDVRAHDGNVTSRRRLIMMFADEITQAAIVSSDSVSLGDCRATEAAQLRAYEERWPRRVPCEALCLL